MRPTELLALLALQLAVPVVADGGTSCEQCLQSNDETEYLHLSKRFSTGGDPPPNPRPRPPPPVPQPPRPPPGSQPASDDLWDNSGAKGCSLGWGMQAPDFDAGALFVPMRTSAKSDYDTTEDLARWFWFPFPEEKVADSFHNLYSTWGIGWALKDLGISDYTTDFEGGKNALISIAHQAYDPGTPDVNWQWYQIGDDAYRATGASYSFTVNPEEGILIALNRESPRYAAKERVPAIPADEMPKLSQFSDVSWIIWKAMHKSPWSGETRLNHLKYFMSVSITNVETQQIIKRALEANHWELEEWPGHTFERIWPETKAILGSPNVQGFAYFLIQHKEQLGGSMFIDKIQVFRGETKAELPCILMHLKEPLGQGGDAVERRASKVQRGVKVMERRKGGILRKHTFRANI